MRKIHSPLLLSSLINFYFLVTEMFHFTIFLRIYYHPFRLMLENNQLNPLFSFVTKRMVSYWLVYYAISCKLYYLLLHKKFCCLKPISLVTNSILQLQVPLQLPCYDFVSVTLLHTQDFIKSLVTRD